MELSHKYEVERMELKSKIAALRERLNGLSTMEQGKEQFIGAVRKFLEMEKLTAPLLRNSSITLVFTKRMVPARIALSVS